MDTKSENTHDTFYCISDTYSYIEHMEYIEYACYKPSYKITKKKTLLFIRTCSINCFDEVYKNNII